MSMLQQFFKKAVQSQMRVAGDMFTFKRIKSNETFESMGVLSLRDGSLTAEVGGAVVQITAHILVHRNELYEPKTGDRVIADGKCYMLINAISSPNDAAWSCDLVQVQK